MRRCREFVARGGEKDAPVSARTGTFVHIQIAFAGQHRENPRLGQPLLEFADDSGAFPLRRTNVKQYQVRLKRDRHAERLTRGFGFFNRTCTCNLRHQCAEARPDEVQRFNDQDAAVSVIRRMGHETDRCLQRNPHSVASTFQVVVVHE